MKKLKLFYSMEPKWGESDSAFNEFEQLYILTKELKECSTPSDIALLKAVIYSGSKLIMKCAREKPEFKDEIEGMAQNLISQLTEVRAAAEPNIDPVTLLEIKNRVVSTFQQTMKLIL